MVEEKNVDATYLLSRLYFGRNINEYDADSIRVLRQILSDQQKIGTNFEKAHQLLLETIKLDPREYHALYELGRDCLAGIDREHQKDLSDEDFKSANEYFTKALKYAKEANDEDYIERIQEQIEKIKNVI